MSSFLRYILRRFGLAIITLIGVAIAVFILTRVLPGDPAALRAGPYANKDVIADLRADMGLDKPIYTQFASYAGLLLQADLGTSWRTQQPVRAELEHRLPATIELAVTAFVMAFILGLTLGVLAAVFAGKWVDLLVRGFATLGASLALFWLGLIGIYVFYYTLGWAPPPLGRLAVGVEAPARVTGLYTIDSLLIGDMITFQDAVSHLWLPASILAFIVSAPIIKITRGVMLDTLSSDFVRTARAIGLPAWRVILVDALRNAFIPVLTTLGAVFGFLMAGNVIIEKVFSWPGIGYYAWEALVLNDFNAVQGFVLLIATTYVFLNLFIDLAYGFVSPRIRLG
jgi:peptide/nickel transport system permease protein